MRQPKTLLFCAALVLALLLLFGLGWSRGPQVTISVAYLGEREFRGERECIVALTNNTSATLQCSGTLSLRRGAFEYEHRFAALLPARSGSQTSIMMPAGDSPAQLRCVLAGVAGQHSAWVRRLGGLLDLIGIHVYHSNRTMTSPLQVRVGRKVPASLSDFLNYQSSTNSWTIP